jgi:hypothetical protein
VRNLVGFLLCAFGSVQADGGETGCEREKIERATRSSGKPLSSAGRRPAAIT